MAFSQEELGYMEKEVIRLNEFNNEEFGWNISHGADAQAQSSILKHSAKLRGRHHNHGWKISAANKGRKKPEGFGAKIRAARVGKSFPQRNPALWKQRLSEVNRGEANPASKLIEQNVLEIRSLVGSVSHKDIGKRFGISPANVSSVATGRVWGFLPNTITPGTVRFNPDTSGARNGNGKLTEREVLEIRAMSNAGSPRAEIARKYNTTPQNIRRIVLRLTWTHI